ncbi:hypothetical protein M430DRAFT_250763 [Amorphotheca resinae ATCC 22711]|uniref:Uncharacterized protein n=1 Tax=Amorphotheca resinae ATCC 22711 TaxID=857342 RepID=A0A2T3B0Q7_AMORE|nr:hypothetical protein M430DRAFT_250763 [Amorphotheca resinae ATCC 22711]PSS16962.1 hypothetical protein M430DRAFT_250763 [Amorphotheca resinae ATCC 22711]
MMKRPLAYSCSPVDRWPFTRLLTHLFPSHPPVQVPTPWSGLRRYAVCQSSIDTDSGTTNRATLRIGDTCTRGPAVFPSEPPFELLVSYPLHPAIPIPFSQESATKIEHRPRKKSSSAPREAPPSPRYPCAAPLRLGVLPSPASERSKPASAVDFSTRAGSPETKRKPPACSESEALACTVRRQCRGAERAK